MINKTISSLAMIQALRKKGLIYIDYFVPFLLYVFKKKNTEKIDILQLGKHIQDEFGLIIPFHGVMSIINRTIKKGYVEKKYGEYYVNKAKINQENKFDEVRNKQIKNLEVVVNTFIQYAHDKFSQILTSEEAQEAFLSFLKKHDVELVLSSNEEALLPEVKRKKSNLYLVSKFIIDIQMNNKDIFKYIVELSFGQIIADCLLFDEVGKFPSNFKGVRFYLDVGIIFNLIGVKGIERQNAFYSFIIGLKKAGAKLYIFEHTYEEVAKNLNLCLYWIDNPLFDEKKAGRTMLFFLSEGFTKDEIELFIIKANTLLEKAEIQKVSKPPYSGLEIYQIGEKELEKCILDFYGDNTKQDRDITIQRDIDSIAAVHRLRKGKRFFTLHDANDIFITTNGALVGANRKFEKEKLNFQHEISTTLTDVFIGTILWVSHPQEYEKLNIEMILADAYAAINPDEVLYKHYIESLRKLRDDKQITVDEFMLLRSHNVAIELLQAKTLNDVNNFTDRTPYEIYQEIKDVIRAEGQARLDEEKKLHLNTQAKLGAEETEKNIYKNKATTIESRLCGITDFVGKVISFICFWGISFIVFFGAVTQICNAISVKIPGSPLVVCSVLTLIIVSVLNLVFNFSLPQLKNNLRCRVAKFLKEKIFKI